VAIGGLLVAGEAGTDGDIEAIIENRWNPGRLAEGRLGFGVDIYVTVGGLPEIRNADGLQM
jgi:hypothetical protein